MPKPDPTVLYRYRGFSGRGIADLERMIVHRELYFSAPLKFNDPFDCRPVFDLQGTKAESLAYCKKVMRKHMPHLNRRQLRAEVKSNLAYQFRPKVAASLQSLHTARVTEDVRVQTTSSFGHTMPKHIRAYALSSMQRSIFLPRRKRLSTYHGDPRSTHFGIRTIQ
jgi:hypothetical protein